MNKIIKLTILLICNLLICNLLIAQSINLTLGSGGTFTLKDASTNYFTLSQSTGQVNILKTLRLENTTSSTTGVIFKGVDRFIHDYGSYNTFVGINSGNFTMEGSENTSMGVYSLYSNTAGSLNTALGSFSLYSNTGGGQNTAIGTGSLQSNTIGYMNTAVGRHSLYFNTTGSQNTAMGIQSLSLNTDGVQNTAVGYNSLSSSTGSNNTALGMSSGDLITTGSNNIAIGYNAQVPSGIVSNQIRMGNTSVYYAGIQVPWTITSDRRWKSDIQNSALGLGFISKLRPVSYFRLPDGKAGNNDESKKTEYGFIAQEVEEVLKETGTENTGMITITDKGMYELRYNDLLAPMVKAIQELKAENDALKLDNEKLTSSNEKLSIEMESLKDMKVKLAELEQSQLEMMKLIKSNNSKEIQSIKISDNK